MEDLAALVLFAQRGVTRGELVGDALREGHEFDEEEVEAGGGEGGVGGGDCGFGTGGGAGHYCCFCGLCCLLVVWVEEDGVLFSLGARTCFGFPGVFVLFEEIGAFLECVWSDL